MASARSGVGMTLKMHANPPRRERMPPNELLKPHEAHRATCEILGRGQRGQVWCVAFSESFVWHLRRGFGTPLRESAF